MSEAEIKEKLLSLSNVQAQQERIVNTLIQHMIDLDMEHFEQVLDNHIMSKGIDRTITQVLFPFLERIGILWLTNHVNPAQEHLVTNIIRQKLIVGIEGAFTHLNSNKTVLLFLPEGEHHELGLLYMYYLLKTRGVKTLYLGANVPISDIEFVARLKKPDYLYSHLTSVAANFNFERFLNQVQIKLNDYQMVVSGLITQHYKKKVPSNVNFKRSLSEVTEYVANL